MIQDYCRESGVRALQKKVDQILRKVALRIAKGQNDPVIVTPENLKDFVGKRVYAPDRVRTHLEPHLSLSLSLSLSLFLAPGTLGLSNNGGTHDSSTR